MTIRNSARLAAAQQLLARFRAAGRPASVGPTRQPPSPAQLRALQRSPRGWPVSQDGLAAQLSERLTGQHEPAQVSTSYCGPAAFLYCLLEDRPDLYVAYAVSLWLRGSYEFGTMDVLVEQGTVTSRSGIQGSAAPERISDLDWMTMAGLSAATRPWFVRGGDAAPDDVTRSITYPWVQKRWFAAVGAQPTHDCMGLGALKQTLFDFVQLMSFWSDHWLVLQIDSSLITGGKTSTFTNRHWVVVDPHQMPHVRRADGAVVPLGSIADQFNAHQTLKGPVYKDGSRLANWPIDLKLVTWGSEGVRLRLPTLGAADDRFYGGYAFPRIK